MKEKKKVDEANCIILHIPHSERSIPQKYRDLFYDSDDWIEYEINCMVDSYTDELFDLDLDKIVFKTNRLLCDVERFKDDSKEIMAKRGMGVCYKKDHNLYPLKDCPKKYKEEMFALYDNHHKLFTDMVTRKLKIFNRCVIIDCHSFSSRRLEYEKCKENKRPDFCIGLNGEEGKEEATRIINRIKEEKKEVYENGEYVKKDYDIKINSPFSGAIKPLKYINDKRVVSIMVEVNRYLYMDEKTGNKNGNFDNLQVLLQQALINVDGHNDNKIKNKVYYLSTHKVSTIAGACMCSQLWWMGATNADFDKVIRNSPNFKN